MERPDAKNSADIRLLIVEDHDIFRHALLQVMEVDGFDIVGVATNGAEAVDLAVDLQPQVILMDVSMPVMDGIEATRRIRSLCPATRVIMLAGSFDNPQILACLDAGAVGYLVKDSDPAELRQGVRVAAAGESPLSPSVASAVLEALKRRRAPVTLSAREQQILTLVGAGFGNKQIAYQLHISEKTVKVHMSRMFQRLGVSDRTQAAIWAERNGLLQAKA